MKCVDLFAGWGGFTLGAEMVGAEVVWAGNHWPLAVEAHALNHPNVEHSCQDLRQADWTKLPEYDVLLASPACQGHSTASQPKRRRYHDALRATAWAVIDCADVTEPSAIVVENVPAFQSWRLYDLWREALVRLGYKVTENMVDARSCGVPQTRKRLVILATRDGATLDLPAPKPVPFRPCVDWDAEGWRPLSMATETAQARFAKGRGNHGPTFLSQHVTGHPGVSLDDSIRTITTKDQWVIVNDDVYRPLTIREYARGMGFPDGYRWPAASREKTIKGLGNAVPPPMAAEAVLAVA
jgi:DNA (cytosine-5)-methyltransferase 1